MRVISICAVGAVLALVSFTAHADCVDPGPAPPVAKGATATEAEMAASHAAIQSFVNQLQSYQTCLEHQIQTAPDDTEVILKQAWRAQGNAAVDLAHDIAADYTRQFQIYKSRH